MRPQAQVVSPAEYKCRFDKVNFLSIIQVIHSKYYIYLIDMIYQRERCLKICCLILSFNTLLRKGMG
jgi:hypothetical protein